MFKSFAIAAATAVGITGFIALTQSEPSKIACDMDGDGKFYIQSIDGKLTTSNAWTLSEDGKKCIAGNGSAEPIILERRDLVDSFGNALNAADPIGLFIEHYSEKAIQHGQKIRLEIQ